MEKIIMGVVFGVAVTILAYEKYCKIKEKEVGKALAPKLQTLIEESSKEILIQRKELGRDLTSSEKNEILDEVMGKLKKW